MDIAKASVADCPSLDHAATTTASTFAPSPTLVKRKMATKHAVVPVKKRSRLMGRPKNDWTPSRKRKLVRLYLMTQLDVEDIGHVLSRTGFMPCKRDIQKQLNTLIRYRPNQIRLKGHNTKRCLRLLRECKDLRQLERAQCTRVSCINPEGSSDAKDIPLGPYSLQQHWPAAFEDPLSDFILKTDFEDVDHPLETPCEMVFGLVTNDTTPSIVESAAGILGLG